MMMYHPFPSHHAHQCGGGSDWQARVQHPTKGAADPKLISEVALLRSLLNNVYDQEEDMVQYNMPYGRPHPPARRFHTYTRQPQQYYTHQEEAIAARVRAEAQEEVRIATEATVRAERRANDLERQLAQRSNRVNAVVDRIQKGASELHRREVEIAEAERRLAVRERALAQREQDLARAEVEARDNTRRLIAAEKIQRRWRQYRATRPAVVLRKSLVTLDRLAHDLSVLLSSDSDTKQRTEGLIRLLEAADAVASNGNPEVRRLRKQHVRNVMVALDAIDSADEATSDESESEAEHQDQQSNEDAVTESAEADVTKPDDESNKDTEEDSEDVRVTLKSEEFEDEALPPYEHEQVQSHVSDTDTDTTSDEDSDAYDDGILSADVETLGMDDHGSESAMSEDGFVVVA